MRKKIVAGNWKMNLERTEAHDLLDALAIEHPKLKSNEVSLIVCPSYVYLDLANKLLSNSEIVLGAQDCASTENGAFTGEVSASMLVSTGVEYVILGHSERREYFNESNELVASKVSLAFNFGLKPIVCVGETLSDREAGRHFDLVKNQVLSVFTQLSNEQRINTIVAYEPVWAIGTGVTATSDQAQEMHSFIRNELKESYSADISNVVPILYGGSCKPSNAQELFACEDVDGGLIGGASLKAKDFLQIANSF